MFESSRSLEPETSPFARILRPAVGFSHPSDVVKDPHLSTDEKRLVLSSWASDACAVDSRPGWRRPLGSDVEVPLAEILEALDRLDRPESRWARMGQIAAAARREGANVRHA